MQWWVFFPMLKMKNKDETDKNDDDKEEDKEESDDSCK